MVKATIEAKTIETTKETIIKQNDEIKNYLKVLEKKMMKGGKKETPEDKIKEKKEIIIKISWIVAVVLLILTIFEAMVLLS